MLYIVYRSIFSTPIHVALEVLANHWMPSCFCFLRMKPNAQPMTFHRFQEPSHIGNHQVIYDQTRPIIAWTANIGNVTSVPPGQNLAKAMTNEQRQGLLEFTTGSFKVEGPPFEGLTFCEMELVNHGFIGFKCGLIGVITIDNSESLVDLVLIPGVSLTVHCCCGCRSGRAM